MKITAFEVYEDERKWFEQQEDKYALDLNLLGEQLNTDTIVAAKGSDAITILGHSRVDEAVLQKMADMDIKVLSTRTIGFNHIDIKCAEKLGIRVTNSRYDPHGVADYTVMLILLLLRKYKQALWRANVNDYTLKGLLGREMRQLTIGVVGTGKIGAQVVKNLSGFGCHIMAHDFNEKEEVKSIATYTDLDTLYEKSDVISFHVPLRDGNYKMINKEALSKMKDSVILINCSRGELMHIEDIIEGVESCKIGALGLDVFEKEDGIYHQDLRVNIVSNRNMAYLRQFPNVIMTQHIAFFTEEAVHSMVSGGIKGALDLLNRGESAFEITSAKDKASR